MYPENDVMLAKIDTQCIYATNIFNKNLQHLYIPKQAISYISAEQQDNAPEKYAVVLYLNNGKEFNFRFISEEQLTSLYELLNR